MNFKKIQSDEKLYALVVLSDQIVPGLNFYTDDKDYLQVGTWRYEQGKTLKAHAHKIFQRTSNKTQEFVYLKQGRLQLDVYDSNDYLIESITLSSGDFAILLDGGHGYKILEDDTQVVEVKNGPYPGLEQDKRLIS